MAVSNSLFHSLINLSNPLSLVLLIISFISHTFFGPNYFFPHFSFILIVFSIFISLLINYFLSIFISLFVSLSLCIVCDSSDIELYEVLSFWNFFSSFLRLHVSSQCFLSLLSLFPPRLITLEESEWHNWWAIPLSDNRSSLPSLSFSLCPIPLKYPSSFLHPTFHHRPVIAFHSTPCYVRDVRVLRMCMFGSVHYTNHSLLRFFHRCLYDVLFNELRKEWVCGQRLVPSAR